MDDAGNSAFSSATREADSNLCTPTATPSISSYTVLMSALWGIVILSLALCPPTRDPATSLPPARTTLDPNVAPWWELSTLPSIGRSIAARLIEYRETAARGRANQDSDVAFHQAADLLDVRGIGPKTLRRIAPHVHFTNPSRSSDAGLPDRPIR